MLERIRQYAVTYNVPIISPETQQFLTNLLQQKQPCNCLEVGSAIGYSSQVMGQTIAPWGGRVISFEISHPSYMLALWHQRSSSLRNITYYHVNVLDTPLQNICRDTIDFVFIDGRKSEYTNYLQTILPYCTEDCTIICDDIISAQDKVTPLSHFLKQQGLSHKLVPLPDGDGLMVIETD